MWHAMARVVAEDLIFDHVLARLHRVEEIGDVLGGIIISLRGGVGFGEWQRR